MSRSGVLSAVALVVFLASTAVGAEPSSELTLDAPSLLKLKAKRDAITVLKKAEQDGHITKDQANQAAAGYLKEAAAVVARPVLIEDLFSFKYPDAPAQSEVPKLTALQRAAGFVTFINVMWVLGILVLVGCFTILAGSYISELIQLLRDVPLVFYEVVFYLAGIGVTAYGYTLAPGIKPFIGLTGCMLFFGALCFTAKMRRGFADKFNFSAILFVVWTAAALAYQSSMLGFIAVLALLGALGFSVIVSPLCVSMGFEGNAALGRATSAGFLMLGVYAGLRAAGKSVPQMQIFETGALFLGSFVGYLGLLIASSRWYDGKRVNYALFQIITIVAGVAALFIGSVFGIGELQKIGGTFFGLYLLEKLCEIPARSIRGYAAIGLVVGGLIYGAALIVKSNEAFWSQYLFRW